MTQTLTNRGVGDRIGLTHSAISRIRSGGRLPSIAVMRRIETEFGWTIQDQVVSVEAGSYHVDFEKVLERSTADVTATAG